MSPHEELVAALDAERYARPWAWARKPETDPDTPEQTAARRAALLADLNACEWMWKRRHRHRTTTVRSPRPTRPRTPSGGTQSAERPHRVVPGTPKRQETQ